MDSEANNENEISHFIEINFWLSIIVAASSILLYLIQIIRFRRQNKNFFKYDCEQTIFNFLDYIYEIQLKELNLKEKLFLEQKKKRDKKRNQRKIGLQEDLIQNDQIEDQQLIDNDDENYKYDKSQKRKIKSYQLKFLQFVIFLQKYAKYYSYFIFSLSNFLSIPIIIMVGYSNQEHSDRKSNYWNFFYALFYFFNISTYAFFISFLSVRQELFEMNNPKELNQQCKHISQLIWFSVKKTFLISFLLTMMIIVYTILPGKSELDDSQGNYSFYMLQPKTAWFWLVKDSILLLLMDRRMIKTELIKDSDTFLRSYNKLYILINNISKYFPQEAFYKNMLLQLSNMENHQQLKDQLQQKSDQQITICKELLEAELDIIDNEKFKNIKTNLGIANLKVWVLYIFFIINFVSAIMVALFYTLENVGYEFNKNFRLFLDTMNNIVFWFDFTIYATLAYLITHTSQILGKQFSSNLEQK